jgi:hypothetical protein
LLSRIGARWRLGKGRFTHGPPPIPAPEGRDPWPGRSGSAGPA